MGSKQATTEGSGTGLLSRWLRTVEALPGARFMRAQAENVETQALRHLQKRLQRVSSNDANTAASKAHTAPPNQPPAAHPAATLQALIDRSLNTPPDRAEQEFYQQVLNQLLPDEARILAALSDGNQAALCHVEASSRLGTHSDRILSNVSRIGVDAGVLLTDNMPYYIGHLVDLGILEIGPENKTLASKYEMVETNSQVRKTCERIENELGMKPKISRHTVQLSELGGRLWQNCQAAP